MFYERSTSAFHQAHIVVQLAALLLTDGDDQVHDPRLTPLVSTKLASLILGDISVSTVSEAEADREQLAQAYAVQVVEGCRAAGPMQSSGLRSPAATQSAGSCLQAKDSRGSCRRVE